MVLWYFKRYVFDPYSGKTVAGPQLAGGRTGAMTISDDSSLVATGGVDGIVTVFKYQAPAAVMQVPPHLQAAPQQRRMLPSSPPFKVPQPNVRPSSVA